MMELGATVCTPRAPRCGECPVAHWCRARALGLADSLPSARSKPKTARVSLAAAVLLDRGGHTLLLRDEDGRRVIFTALAIPGGRRRAQPPPGTESVSQRSLGVTAATIEVLASARHTVTFRDIRLLPFLVRVERLPAVPGTRTPPLGELDRLPISSATKKIAASALRAI